ncbi:ribonuclease H-like domain-containing protein [Tanacetum coccineum]|uniref:Ribonuclease H-like domain-containing protein n=1 Tax=Tanacetum coccineum TaxID=301880 RepID=A0ABQ5HER3_9ASTR
MIKELTSLQDDWCIKVRIIRLWKLMALKNPLETWKIEMVLQDDEENKTVATVKESICPKFEKYLIGDLISCGTIDHAMVDGNRRPFIRLELEDLTLIENRSHEGDDHCVTHLTTYSSYSIKNDFLNNLLKVCINDICDIGKKIERESDWWYLTCVKCNHKANQDTVTEKDEYGVVVKKRIVFMYKIPLRVMDSTGSVSLTLFNRQAHPIIDKSASELLQEVRKEIQSNSQSFALELMSHPASSFMSPPSGSKLATIFPTVSVSLPLPRFPLLEDFPLMIEDKDYSESKTQMDPYNHTTNTSTKLPILDTGKFEQWKFRIQQYLQHEHYALWEVIEFGDSYKVPPEEPGKAVAGEASAKKKGRTVAITTEDMQKRRNDVKARTTLLLALPDEHQLRFSKYDNAKELWEAILKTFGGNEATKKTKKNQLKQQYGNFKAEGSETLEQTFNRL